MNETPNKQSEQKAPQLSQEQIKQLMAMMQNQKQMPAWKQKVSKFINVAMQNTTKAIQQIDRFINFIIQKEDIDRNNVIQTARGPIVFGTYVIIIFIVIGGLWTALAPLDSASVAMGTVIPSSKRKTIQYSQNGIVKDIYVKLGDHVREGDPIIALDEVLLKSQYDATLSTYRSFLANEARLNAEKDNLKEIKFDDFLLKDSSVPQVASLIASMRDLFASRQDAYFSMIEALEQRNQQLLKQLESAKAKQISTRKNAEIYAERLKAIKNLYEKGAVNKSHLQDAESRQANAESDFTSTEAEIARINQAILADKAEMASKKSQHQSDILRELSETQTRLSDARERYLQAKDYYEKAVLRSPVDGTIIDIGVSTVGGVISPNHVIAEIVPDDDKLVIEARVPQKTIDSVHVGLRAKIRFSAFKSRTSPVFTGTLVSLSPDIEQDRQGMPQDPNGPYYKARVEIDMEEFNKVAKKRGLKLRPGMQAEIQIVIGTRTLLQYLLDPLTDNMFKAFKEK